MVIVTIKYLEKHDACDEAIEWVKTKKKRDFGSLVKLLIKEKKDLKWGVWYLSRKLPKMDKLRLAIYAASVVCYLYEKKYPDDKRPRRAIHAARNYLNNPSSKNQDTAFAAAWAAHSAACSSYYADDENAGNAAFAAANAAACAATFVSDHAYVSNSAYCAAANAMSAAKKDSQIEILKYGLKLLNKKDLEGRKK